MSYRSCYDKILDLEAFLFYYQGEGVKKMEHRAPVVEETVVWHDTKGKGHEVLVTAVHNDHVINIVRVSNNKNEQDQYGRQLKRESSVTHKSMSQVHGNYWRFPWEDPNQKQPPQQV